jgi:hypothetical protein
MVLRWRFKVSPKYTHLSRNSTQSEGEMDVVPGFFLKKQGVEDLSLITVHIDSESLMQNKQPLAQLFRQGQILSLYHLNIFRKKVI